MHSFVMDERIHALEREIAALPAGSISWKTVKGHSYHYHRWSEGGRRKEKFLSSSELEAISMAIEHRKCLEAELKSLKGGQQDFFLDVRTGERLQKFVSPVSLWKKRSSFANLESYVHGDNDGRVFVLYGLRRVGKSTLMRQVISCMDSDELKCTAYIQVQKYNTLTQLRHDLRLLEDRGFTYMFIDEVTWLEDFIECASLFSDWFCQNGMKIVLSGTDSLSFLFAEDEQLYDRCFIEHMTFIPFREAQDILGFESVDEFLKHGGLMSTSGREYGSLPSFRSVDDVNEYVDRAVASNIQHSLRYYREGSHFRNLEELYLKGELTGAVNRVVEDMNHRCALEVLEKTFSSSDLAISRRNFRRDGTLNSDILERIDLESFTRRLKEKLDILDSKERTVKLEQIHADEIGQYLKRLDLFVEVEEVFLPFRGRSRMKTLVAQPALRWWQADALIKTILADDAFSSLDFDTLRAVTGRVECELLGRMLEERILLETMMAKPMSRTVKVLFDVGEIDMVVQHRKDSGGCSLFEIKHGREVSASQRRHILDEVKCAMVEHFFGPVLGRFVIYNGPDLEVGSVHYRNAALWLNSFEGIP